MSKVFERVEELERLIPYYAEKYYQGESEISDEEFDSLVEELEQLNPDSEILKKTGWGSEGEKGKVKIEHYYTEVGSLKKTREFGGLPDEFKNIVVNISPKLDGLSAVCYYKNGKLDKAVTRGNGKVGIDITDKLNLILSKKNINLDNFTGAIRGELLISKENWLIIKDSNENAMNSRNYAAGIINRNDLSEDLQYVDFVTYKILGDESKRFNSKLEVVEFLQNAGFDTIWNIRHTICIKENWDEYSKELYKQDYKYQIDGLVLSRDELKYNERNGIEYTEFAYKFESTKAESIVKDIIWQLSRSGRMVPVINIEPTEIDETTVSRITGNNAKNIKDLKVSVGSKIEFMKANEIIPYLTKVIDPVEPKLPETCPVCGGKLEWNGVDLVCHNDSCLNLQLQDLKIWTDILGKVDGLAWLIKSKYFEDKQIDSIEKLHEYLKNLDDKELSNYTSITDNKMVTMYKKFMNEKYSLIDILCALNIPRLGYVSAKKIYCSKEATEIILRLSKEETISGTIIDPLTKIVGPATVESILEKSEKLKRIHLVNFEIRDFDKKEETIEQKGTFCVTGKLESMKRADLVKLAESKGWKALGGVNKDCNYLVTNDKNSGSSKNKMAQQLGTKIIDEKEFLEMLGE